MKKIAALLVCFLCATSSTFAQQNIDDKQVILKFAPFKLISPEVNVSFSAERRVNSKFSYQLQADYTIIDANNAQQLNYSSGGFRLIPEARYYYSNTQNNMTGSYIGINMMYKYLRKSYEEFIIRTDGAGQSYQELTPMWQKKQVLAPHLLMGWLFYLGQSKKLSIDVNAGLGARYRFIDRSVTNQVRRDELFLFNTENEGAMISAACNLKLGYSLFR